MNAPPITTTGEHAEAHVLLLPTRLLDLVRAALVRPPGGSRAATLAAALDVIDAGIAAIGLRVRRSALQNDELRAWTKTVFGDGHVYVPVEFITDDDRRR